MSAFRLVCAGCGTPAPPVDVDPFPFRCRCASTLPDVDHVMTKLLDPPHVAATNFSQKWEKFVAATNNPFLRYRKLLYSYDVLETSQGTDAAEATFARMVGALDDGVFAVSGQRFRVTPFGRSEALSAGLGFTRGGGVWIKDETGNVSGSHKARHLAEILLYLRAVRDPEFVAATNFSQKWEKFVAATKLPSPGLAIASCGNAALAAAVVARAAGWPLQTFVPPDANPTVLQRLRELAATIVVCPRRPAETGDPCYRRFREAVEQGALPFCCQGPDNGLTIEGGETLAYEMIDGLRDTGLDALVVQVGGGALASACVQGFERAQALGRVRRMPRLYTVQTHGAAPLSRAHERVAARAARDGIESALRYAATHRSEFMWPWDTTPRSIAHGILDDETYDWLAIVRGMLQTGGAPVVVDEETLVVANEQGRNATGIDVDHTGSAGLAGLMALRARGDIKDGEQAAVIFTGARRTDRG